MNINTVAPGAETSAKQANDKRYAEARAKARDLGRDKADGDDALPKLSNVVVNAAYEGAINGTDKVKSKVADESGKFPMVSHVQDIFEAYSMAITAKAVHERSAGSVKTQVSKLNSFFKLGTLPNVDGPAVWLRAAELYKKVNGVKRNPDAIPAYDFYIKVATTQCHEDNRDKALDDDAMMKLMMRKDKGPKTLEKELNRALDILENLISGEGPDKLKDTDPLTEQAFNCLRDRLAALTKAKEIEELRAKAKALGIAL